MIGTVGSDTLNYSLTTTATTTSGVGTYPIAVALGANPNYAVTATDATLTVTYQTAGGLCLGEAGHSILQPINAGGASVFKQKSTVPAKFRVCDAAGHSVGEAGVVTRFVLYQTISGTATATVNEAVDSTTPDAAFRWDSVAQQWIFNISHEEHAGECHLHLCGDAERRHAHSVPVRREVGSALEKKAGSIPRFLFSFLVGPPGRKDFDTVVVSGL